MKDVMATLAEWDAAGLASAEAILVGVQHSSPRQPGARLLVNEKGEMAGGVSMGCVESDLHSHLMALLREGREAGLVHYGASFGELLEVGLSCGGEIDVWLRRRDPATEAWRGVRGLSAKERAMLLTRLGGESEQVLLREGDAAPRADMQAVVGALWGRGGTRRFEVDGAMWFAEVIAPKPLLLIVGASPISMALCELASRTDFRVALVDPREAFARADLFPDAERVVHEWPGKGLRAAGMDEHSFVAVVAHDAKLDVPALAAALQARCHYIGLLGSAGTQADRRGQLEAMGFAADDVARIRGPIGLKGIGALEPTEIAVSILAELIMARRGKLSD